MAWRESASAFSRAASAARRSCTSSRRRSRLPSMASLRKACSSRANPRRCSTRADAAGRGGQGLLRLRALQLLEAPFAGALLLLDLLAHPALLPRPSLLALRRLPG